VLSGWKGASCVGAPITPELHDQLCNVPIFGFPCSAVRGDLVSLCQPGQRSKMRLTVSSGNLEELYGAQASPFAIFHHQDHFRTVRSWFRGVPMISVILGYY
jgi:hypothetical protein